MIDTFYSERLRIQEFKTERDRLSRIIRKNIQKLEKRIGIYVEAMNSRERIEDNLLKGELLSANLYQINRGSSKATVMNYYTNEQYDIPLDPSVSPAQNVNRFFRKAQKLKNGMKISEENYAREKPELDYLLSLEYDLGSAADTDDLDAIRNELVRCGYITLQRKEKTRNIDPLSRPYLFRSTDGLRIMAGRNSRQNDLLTMRIANEKDIWFHIRNSQGSHVILFTDSRVPTERDIYEAAVIASTYSREKNSSKVDIDYTERKNAWKANGARPGMVLYKEQKTITVDPDSKLTEKLRTHD